MWINVCKYDWTMLSREMELPCHAYNAAFLNCSQTIQKFHHDTTTFLLTTIHANIMLDDNQSCSLPNCTHHDLKHIMM